MFHLKLTAMTANFENEILFDDVAALEDKLGEAYLSITSLTANCDCSSYTSVQDDEDMCAPQGSRTAS